MKKITSLAIVLTLLLCSITTVFAADLDLINQVDDSKNFSWNEFVRVPTNLRYVSDNIDDYLIEFEEQFYRAAQVNAAIDAGAENFEEAIKELEPVEKPIEGLEVVEVSAIDATTVEVEFGKDVELTAADLADAKVLVGEMEATFVGGTFDATAKTAQFKLAGEDKLVDAEEYTVTSDWTTDYTFQARFGDKYVAEFVKVTTGIPATAFVDQVAQDTKVTFSALDQYGDPITAPATIAELAVKVNGMPLVVDTEVEYATGVVTIKEVLAEGDVVEITLTTKDADDKVVANNTFEYTVVKAAALVPTTIEVNAKDVSLPAQDSTDLTVKVLDQFNNEITDSDAAVRFVVNGKVVTPGTGAIINGSDGNYTFGTDTPGEYVIQVFSTVDSKVTASTTITVGSAKLTGLIVGTVEESEGVVTKNKYNNEDLIIATVAPSPGAVLVAENVKLNVTTATEGLTAADVVVSTGYKTVGTGSEAKEVIVINAKTSKPGTFTVTPYVGASFEDDEVIKGDAVPFTTDLNPEIASYEVEGFVANELTAGGSVDKVVTFKNKHGEVIIPDTNKVDINVNPTGLTVGKTTPTNEDDEVEFVLTFDAEEAPKGDYTVTLIANGIAKQLAVKVVDTAKVAKINVADKVSVINNDDAEELDLLPISFEDQYGNEMEINANDDKLSDNLDDDSDYEITYYDEDEEKIDENGVIAFVGISTELTELPDKAKAIEIIYGSGDDEVKATINVTVLADRAIKELSVTPLSGSAVVKAPVKFKLTGVDQYGDKISLADKVDKVHLENANDVDVALQNKAIDKGAITFELKSDKAGVYNAVVFIGDDAGNRVTGTNADKFVTIPFTVSEIGDAIASVEIQPEVKIGDVEYDASEYKVKVNKTGETTVEFAIKAFDANNNEVAINADDIIWTVKDNSLVKDEDSTVVVTNNGNVNIFTIAAADKGTLTVSATTLNGKVAEFTITVGSDEGVAQAGTYKVATSKNGLDNDEKSTVISEVVLDKKAVDGEVTVHIIATDQYGKVVNVNESTEVVFGLDSNAIVAKSETAEGIQLKSKALGTTNLRVFVNGTQEIVIPVTVKEHTAAQGVEVDPAKLTLKVGDKGQITATVKPSNATNKDVTWKSSDEAVAKVDENGEVTAQAAGEATITVTSVDGSFTASTTVTIGNLLVEEGGSIQAAIDTADTGDTILVAAGTYDEIVGIKDKSITIIGGDKEETKIKAISAYPGTDNNLTVKNLTIYGNNGSGQSYAGIFISNGNVIIEGCILTPAKESDNTKRSIETQYNNSANITIKDCDISGYKSSYFNPTTGKLVLQNNNFNNEGPSIDSFEKTTITGNTNMTIGLFIGYELLDVEFEDVLNGIETDIIELAIALHNDNPGAVVKLSTTSTGSPATWGGFLTAVEDGELVIIDRY